MRNLSQTGVIPHQGLVRLRWVAVLCVLLIAVMSAVQVSHSHALMQSNSHQNFPESGPDHCPLCVAMHSAMPTGLQSVPDPVVIIQTVDSVAAHAQRTFRWHFQLASRPPPADSLRS